MFIDEKGKIFGKVNLLDILIILIVIAAVLFGAWYFMRNKGGDGSKLPVSYTVEVVQKDEAYFEHIIEGESVVDGKTKQPMGTIVSHEKRPARILTQNNENLTLEYSTIPGKYDGYIVIEVDADIDYPDLKSGDEAVKIGKSVAYRSESAAIHGYIVGIDYDEEKLKEMK